MKLDIKTEEETIDFANMLSVDDCFSLDSVFSDIDNLKLQLILFGELRKCGLRTVDPSRHILQIKAIEPTT